jgi:hypothetical protein
MIPILLLLLLLPSSFLLEQRLGQTATKKFKKKPNGGTTAMTSR